MGNKHSNNKHKQSSTQHTQLNQPTEFIQQQPQQNQQLNVVQEQAESYYKNLGTSDQIPSSSSPKSQIQIQIAIRGAELGPNYSVKACFTQDQVSSLDIGTTNPKQADQNGNVNFDMSFILDYYFEKQQPITFYVNKDTQSFTVNSTVGNIMGSRGQLLLKDIIPGISQEKLAVSATTLKNINTSVALDVSAVFDIPGVRMFFVIKKPKNMRESEYISVYKSEVREVSNNGSYIFDKIKIPSSILCNGDFDCPVVIEFYDFMRQFPIGFYQSSVDKLASSDAKFEIKIGGQTQNASNVLSVNCQCNFVKEYTFLDYLRGGTQLALSIGIDFTGSNGNPKDSGSLHNTKTMTPNSYEKAIRSCGDIVAYYDYDQVFPVYGYGAVLPGQYDVSMCFPLTLTDDPNIPSIDNVLLTYRQTVNSLRFSGPTYFAPLIKEAMKNIQNANNQNVYNILLILTDGLINDIDNTIDAIVDVSYMPLSIIIVGIGKTDFSSMDVLDADKSPLVDRKGRKAMRDIVQFVPFYKYENNGVKLAEQVLEEVPRQLVDYYKLKGVPPGDPVVLS